MKTRFICAAFTAIVMLTRGEGFGQIGQPNDLPARHRSIGNALSVGSRNGGAQTTIGPDLTLLPQHGAPRFIPLGVKHRVPQDYSSIQAAINASSNGDTVLVSEGTYKENIRYLGKAITVASLYLIDGDTTHIAKTIIDGSGSTQPDSGSVVYFINGEDTTSVLCGFTIQGGSGTRFYYNVSPWYDWQMQGGGIYCQDAGARIVRNIIARNRVVAQVAGAGGIEAFGTGSHLPFLILDSNRIRDNFVENDTSSTSYWGWSGGADIGTNARIVGNVFERDSVIGNSGGEGGGMQIVSYNSDSALPNAYIAGNVFRSNIVSAQIQGADGGALFVYWTGNITIINNVFNSNTALSSGVSAGFAEGGGLYIDDRNFAGYGQRTIVGNQFTNNAAVCSRFNQGGGLELLGTQASVSGCVFTHNVTSAAITSQLGYWNGGAGISIRSSTFRLENNIVAGNISGTTGGALLNELPPSGSAGTEQAFVNNTFVNNRAAAYGGGLMCNYSSGLVILNNILWNDTAVTGPEIYNVAGSLGPLAYCDVKGGYAGTADINVDPAFVSGDTLYHLKSSSPCVGRGIDSIQLGGAWYKAPTSDYDGNSRPMPLGTRPDMGAQEEQHTATPVFRRVQQDYATIQAAINSSNAGDIVLVSEGTYKENIRYRGKAITVASLYFIDGDAAHIAKTIIDGSGSTQPDSGSVVYFINGEDTTSTLCGFTIQGGTGTLDPSLNFRGGGGIWCDSAGARIVENTIKHNRVIGPGGDGGGIEVNGRSNLVPTVLILSNRITDNYAYDPNGLPLAGGSGGAGIYGATARVINNVFERDTVGGKDASLGGGLLIEGTNGTGPWPSGSVIGNVFRSNIAFAGQTEAVGGGISLRWTGQVTIQGNFFESNTATSSGSTAVRGGGGICARSSAFLIQNNVFKGNSSSLDGGALYVEGTPQAGTYEGIINNTFVNNRAAAHGGALCANAASYVALVNNVLWNDTASSGPEISTVGSIAGVAYCDVKGLVPGTGNINADPAFFAGDSLFHLTNISPCIQGGIDSMQVGGVWYYAPVTDYGGLPRPMPKGTRPDIGAQEEQITIGVYQRTPNLPTQFALMQNYPNPFNPSTTIPYALPQRSRVTLSVYNTLGQRVRTLVSGEEQPGYHEVKFDGSNLASGVYFYRLTAGSFVQTRKLLLIK